MVVENDNRSTMSNSRPNHQTGRAFQWGPVTKRVGPKSFRHPSLAINTRDTVKHMCTLFEENKDGETVNNTLPNNNKNNLDNTEIPTPNSQDPSLPNAVVKPPKYEWGYARRREIPTRHRRPSLRYALSRSASVKEEKKRIDAGWVTPAKDIAIVSESLDLSENKTLSNKTDHEQPLSATAATKSNGQKYYVVRNKTEDKGRVQKWLHFNDGDIVRELHKWHKDGKRQVQLFSTGVNDTDMSKYCLTDVTSLKYLEITENMFEGEWRSHDGQKH